MRIACPSCDATYDVPDRLLAGPARNLRCSRCGTEFALPRDEAVAPAPVVAAPPPAPEPDPAPPVADPPSRPAPVLRPEPPVSQAPEPIASRALAPVAQVPSPALARAWVASIVAVAAAVAGFLVFHAKVMEVWPASTRLFAALGLA